MKQRGRKSAASIEILPQLTKKRPEPPENMTEPERKEWQRIVNRMPVDWFPDETHPLLVNMCRAIVMCDELTRQIASLGPAPDRKELNALLLMRDRENKAIVLCATKLRLTNQSRMRADHATVKARPEKKAKPWEYSG